ncbi:MAG: hypothetical protein ABIF71_04855 [Planctomycetota bacterium]
MAVEKRTEPAWFERLFIGRAEHIGPGERRKRLFLAFCMLVAIVTIMVMDLMSFFGNTATELLVDGISVAVLLANFILLRILRRGILLYRFDAFLIGSLFVYYTIMDNGIGTSVLWSLSYPLTVFYLFGRKEGLAWIAALAAALGAVIYWPDLGCSAMFGVQIKVRFTGTFVIVTVLSYGLEYLRATFEEESTRLIAELQIS